jgi:hypothetical protein
LSDGVAASLSLTFLASVTSSTVEQSTAGIFGFFGFAALAFCAKTVPLINISINTATRILLILFSS